MTYCVDLVHRSLEAREDRRHEDTPESQGRLVVVTERQQIFAGIFTSNDDMVRVVLVLLVTVVATVISRSSVDLALELLSVSLQVVKRGLIDRQALLLIDLLVGRDFRDVPHHVVEAAQHDGIGEWCRHIGGVRRAMQALQGEGAELGLHDEGGRISLYITHCSSERCARGPQTFHDS